MARPNALTRNALQRVGQKGGWSMGLNRFQQQIDAFAVDLLPELGALMHQSIVYGSPLTGAPGQPEDEGDLRRSWRIEYPTPSQVAVVTDSPYARFNEDGARQGGKPYIQRSAIGGRYSVRLTRRALDRLVAEAARRTTTRAA